MDITLQIEQFGFPTPEHPYYHARLRLDAPPADLTVTRVLVNAVRVRDFTVYSGGLANRKHTWAAGQPAELVARVDWADGSTVRIAVQAEDAAGARVELAAEGQTLAAGGWWDARWKYYGATVLAETIGAARAGEPVHLWLGLYADRLTDPAREIRVVGIDPVSGQPQEVPSQVYGVSTWDKFADEHCQPTTTVGVAFLADVPAHAQKVYLIFYGNPDAPAPAYPTDLRVSGSGLGLTVENSHYTIRLHPDSGAIDEIHLKQNVNRVFAHHLETNGALHWNPGVYAPPRTWMHASDWNPPQHAETIVGPVFAMTRRWGPLPDYPEVACSITYLFYHNTPYVMESSVLDVTRDLDVVALRNGELVVNQDVVDEFAWKQPDSAVGTVVIKTLPRHPVPAMEIDARAPWWAFFNRDVPCALAAINLELSGMQRADGLAQWEPYFYLHWGPWYYCARPLVYTFITPNPQRLIHVSAGSSYYERMAFYPCRLGNTDADRFAPIEQTAARLFRPLRAGVVRLDTDARVPEDWVPPILVSEFEELED